MKLFFCGGDLRMAETANLAAARGDETYVIGLEDAPDLHPSLHHTSLSSLGEADRILLPLPLSRDEEHLFAPFSKAPISLATLWQAAKPHTPAFGGKISESLLAEAQKAGITLTDYLKEEEFAVANATPTAEGAVQIAMEQLRCTLADCNVLVLGYGRVGMLLAHRLQFFARSVTVCCRNPAALALAKGMQNRVFPLFALPAEVGKFDLIYNTIPHPILTREVLDRCKKQVLLMELASAPFGIDEGYCRKKGLRHISCQGLPGRVAPITGGRIILEITDRLAREGVVAR